MSKEEKKESSAATSSSSSSSKKSEDSTKKDSSSPDAGLSPQQQTIKLIRTHVFLLRKGVILHDTRLVTRVLRQLTQVRHKLTPTIIKALAKQYQPQLLEIINQAQSSLMEDSETAGEDLSPPTTTAAASSSSTSATSDAAKSKKTQEQEEKEKKEAEMLVAHVPEVDIYIQLLTALFLLDRNLKQESTTLFTNLFHSLATLNRRSMDPISAKIYYFYALIHEQIGRDQEIRNSLLAAHRTACLQHNEPGQAALSVAILRNYLRHHLYTQADTFRLKSSFPDQRSNAQTARYCYYIGQIQAMQLHYSDAFASLTTALRKAPQQRIAVGFRQACTKLLVLVQLLMGDIPERSLFSPKDLRQSLAPVLALTQAVRIGDLALFNEVMQKHKQSFEQDGIYSLIVRLRSNVIKAGLRKINLAYSKISLQDICTKLAIHSMDDAEYIVAKAIHDGVIEANIDRDQRCLISKEVGDVYATNEPQQAYHKRIQFTLDIHQQAVKSLRYPPQSHRGYEQWESDDEEDEDVIAGNVPDKREEDKKKEG